MTLLEFPDESGPGPAACLNLYSRLAAGVTVVTAAGPRARAGAGPTPSVRMTGMTASSVTSVSLRPPLLLVSVAHHSRTLTALRRRRAFAVHLLRADQRGLAEHFAAPAQTRYAEAAGLPELGERSVLGVPVLPDVLAWSVCLLEAEHAYGDHILVIGRVVAAHVGSGRPLLWHDRAFAQLAG